MELAALCKFSDYSHTKEPGCAVRKAVINGKLSEERLQNYFKLQDEIGYDGLNFRQREEEKIKRMFGSMAGMKQAVRHAKNKNRRR